MTFELRRCPTGRGCRPFLDAWKAKHPSVSGHQGRYSSREIVNSIFYQNRTGCQWVPGPGNAGLGQSSLDNGGTFRNHQAGRRHVGTALLRMLADRAGLTGVLSAALARTGVFPVHGRGRVLVDLAVMIADGGEAICDIDVLRHQSSEPPSCA